VTDRTEIARRRTYDAIETVNKSEILAEIVYTTFLAEYQA
jgi:hypothetical protein